MRTVCHGGKSDGAQGLAFVKDFRGVGIAKNTVYFQRRL